MKNIKPFIKLLFILAASSPIAAHACMGPGPDGYVSGLIWRTSPSEIPKDAFILKIKFVRGTEEWGGFWAKVTEGPKFLINRHYRFIPEFRTSCVALGNLEGYIVARRKMINIQNKYGKMINYFAAVDYKPSPRDEIARLLTSENWHHPGQPNKRDKNHYPSSP